ncbi:hypothetical protein [Kitasatospora kifunensis]|uniref:Uncharacterized protein n=1 Tax=Kitasatospora kifunensis TaxID=58351 RepID=A0A7W7RC25_KITKI|nr:hypothetical protein [Kitasatospora kifunensis]MBB4928646.1 hypothetical protein [Kitasatospora kifunensis]
MASVVGLLEERELAARKRVESLREEVDRVLAELRDAETDWERWMIARERVDRVLSEPRGAQAAEAAGAGAPVPVPEPVPGRAAATRSVVPVWRPKLAARVLAVEYQRIVNTLVDRQHGDDGPAMSCQEIAVALGLELAPAKIEGAVRSRAKRLVARGWPAEDTPGRFSTAAGPGAGS